MGTQLGVHPIVSWLFGIVLLTGVTQTEWLSLGRFLDRSGLGNSGDS